MYKSFVVLTLVCVASVFMPCAAQAVDENIEFGFGTVHSVDATKNRIVVLEYDYNTEGDVSVTYEINADTELDNIASLGEIKAGDEIDIEYYVDAKGKKIAKYLDVTGKMAEEEPMMEQESQDDGYFDTE